MSLLMLYNFRHLRGDLALLQRAIERFSLDFIESELKSEFIQPPPFSYDFISEAISGSSESPQDYKRFGVDKILHLESHQALASLYSQFGRFCK